MMTKRGVPLWSIPAPNEMKEKSTTQCTVSEQFYPYRFATVFFTPDSFVPMRHAHSL